MINKIHTVGWHKECCFNSKEYHKKEIEQLKEKLNRLIRAMEEVEFHEYQIECAIKEKKKTFDPQRYKIKHRENFIQQPLFGSGANAPTPKPPEATSYIGKRCRTFEEE